MIMIMIIQIDIGIPPCMIICGHLNRGCWPFCSHHYSMAWPLSILHCGSSTSTVSVSQNTSKVLGLHFACAIFLGRKNCKIFRTLINP